MKPRKKFYVSLVKNFTQNLFIGNIISNIVLIILAIRIVSVTNINYKVILVEIFMIIFTLLFLNIYYYKSISKVKIEKEKTEINYRYNEVVSELIENIKGNQHEYKNHINTITSIIYLSNDVEEAKMAVNKYTKSISSEFDFNRVLSIDNTVLRAIIYSKAIECEEKCIEFTFIVEGNIRELNIEGYDLTVILSNILNNAIESAEKSIKKKVKLKIHIGKIKTIIVGNSMSDTNKLETEKFLNRGFSNKGKGRGYGLYNVKKAINRYSGGISILIEDNWVSVKISI